MGQCSRAKKGAGGNLSKNLSKESTRTGRGFTSTAFLHPTSRPHLVAHWLSQIDKTQNFRFFNSYDFCFTSLRGLSLLLLFCLACIALHERGKQKLVKRMCTRRNELVPALAHVFSHSLTGTGTGLCRCIFYLSREGWSFQKLANLLQYTFEC